MFALTINHPRTSSLITHPSRDIAYGELVTFVEATGHGLRVEAATWTRADYQILGHDDRVIGHAAIDEICACTHTEREHTETGCTAISFDAGPFAECGCTGHRPVDAEADLFSSEAPT
ncbi:MAG: hypothetical protein QOI29_134 [Mycobacterium sp.]|jgi:hypothetical protein|nr:hypothetical protein [Mycobacterium sp.]